MYNSIDVNHTLGLDTDSSIQNVQTMNANQLYGVSNNNLCVAYYQNQPPLVKDEINRRKLVTSYFDWKNINSHETKPGMNLCGVLASLGKPNSLDSGDQFLELHYDGKTVVMRKKNGIFEVVDNN